MDVDMMGVVSKTLEDKLFEYYRFYLNEAHSNDMEAQRILHNRKTYLQEEYCAIHGKKGVFALSRHPDDFEICLVDGQLRTTLSGKFATCGKCNGKRLLHIYWEDASNWLYDDWYCLDCGRYVMPNESA